MHIIVVFQLILICTIVLCVYGFVSYRERRAPVDDIGILWLILLSLYCALPPFVWLLKGGKYATFYSGKLFNLQPSPQEIVYLLNVTLAYIIGFSITYFFFRRPRNYLKQNGIPFISNSKFMASIFIIGFAKIIPFALSYSGLIRTPESYVDSYKVIQEAPLAIRQILLLFQSSSILATTVFIVAILQRWPRYKFLFFIFILSNAAFIEGGGGRASIVLKFLMIILAWHALVKPIKTKTWAISGFLGLFLFTLWGIRRSFGSWSRLSSIDTSNLGLGELDSIWGNAVHILQLKNAGEINLDFTTRFAEFWSYIPSQLLPFTKTDLSNWYVFTYYPQYAENGGAWAFGAISQAIAGGGLIEAFIRGILMAIIATWLIKWYRSSKATWWRYPVYLNLLVYCFMAVRVSTFQQLGNLIQMTLPSVLLVLVIGAIFTKKKKFVTSATTLN